MTTKLDRVRLCAWLGAALLALQAQAADPVTDALQAAYVPYRAALFKTNGKSQPEAEAAVAEARRAWQGLVAEPYARGAPVPYAADARLAATLQQVGDAYRQAEAEVRAGQLPKAHDTLEQVRDLLSELRARNGVAVFSDPMNAYHEQMEQMLGSGAALARQSEGWMLLAGRVGVLEYLAAELKSRAPAALASQADFAAAQQAVADSVAALRAAVLARDADAVQRAIAGLKGPYSRMFLKFG